MKTGTHISVNEICDSLVESFRASGDLYPTHCDVRCAVNDAMESYERDGFSVNHEYSQDRAFRYVRSKLGTHGMEADVD